MNSTVLLRKLIAIERSIGTANSSELRELVQDAEDCLLEMQRERVGPFCSEPNRDVAGRFRMLREAAQNW